MIEALVGPAIAGGVVLVSILGFALGAKATHKKLGRKEQEVEQLKKEVRIANARAKALRRARPSLAELRGAVERMPNAPEEGDS